MHGQQIIKRQECSVLLWKCSRGFS